MVTGIIILTLFGVLCQANRAPKKFPRRKVTIIETYSNPNVQGNARLTMELTVVGKKAIE